MGHFLVASDATVSETDALLAHGASVRGTCDRLVLSDSERGVRVSDSDKEDTRAQSGFGITETLGDADQSRPGSE